MARVTLGRVEELTADQTSEEEGVDGESHDLSETPERLPVAVCGRSDHVTVMETLMRLDELMSCDGCETGLRVNQGDPDPVVAEESRTGCPEAVHLLKMDRNTDSIWPPIWQQFTDILSSLWG